MSSDTPRTDALIASLDECHEIPLPLVWRNMVNLARQLERENAELRQQLVERDALVERMIEALKECDRLMDSANIGASDKTSEIFTSITAGSLTPSTALAEHDAEIRRKALYVRWLLCIPD